MFRRYRPTFENLEKREVFSAGPLAGLSPEAVTTHHSPVAQVGSDHAWGSYQLVAAGDAHHGARPDLARAVARSVDFNREGGSQAASNPPPISPAEMPEFLPQDLYGDTMSIEEWMDWTARPHDPANGDSIFDFPGGRGRQ